MAEVLPSAQRPEVQALTFFRDGLPSALVVLGRQVQNAPPGRPDFPAETARPVPPGQTQPVAHAVQRVHSQPVRCGGQLPLRRSTAPVPAVPPIRSNGFVGSVFSWHTHLSPVFRPADQSAGVRGLFLLFVDLDAVHIVSRALLFRFCCVAQAKKLIKKRYAALTNPDKYFFFLRRNLNCVKQGLEPLFSLPKDLFQF